MNDRGEWPADRVTRVPVSSLTASSRNARVHSDAQIAQIADAIERWGWTIPILVDELGIVIAGHARLEAGRRLGLVDVPVVTASGWSDAQKRAYALADNKLALNSSWDEDMLRVELVDLARAGEDLGGIGFSVDDLALLVPAPASTGADPAEDRPEDDLPAIPPPVTRTGDVWQLGRHRLACGDSTDPLTIARLFDMDRAALLFTSPPYGQQREYTTNGISDWDALMTGVFRNLDDVMHHDGQVLVNLGLIHRAGEWIPYWESWTRWMSEQGWRRFGWYVWDQGPGLPGDWNGRLAPAFEFLFHFNREAKQANKIVECRWAGHVNSEKGGLRGKDGTVGTWTHAGQGVQDMRIPDTVLRITRHKARGMETEHPAVFPILLPEFVMKTYSEPGDIVFEPFSGSGTTILAGETCGREVRAIDLAPEYVDLAIARWILLHPDMPVTLHDTGASYSETAAARSRTVRQPSRKRRDK